MHSLDSEMGHTRRSSPRLGNTIRQLIGVKLGKWSQENPKMLAFAYGNYLCHNYAGLSKVPAEQLAAFHRGTDFICLLRLFCREGDYPEDVGQWPETRGNANTIFQSSGELDRHMLSYHLRL